MAGGQLQKRHTSFNLEQQKTAPVTRAKSKPDLMADGTKQKPRFFAFIGRVASKLKVQGKPEMGLSKGEISEIKRLVVEKKQSRLSLDAARAKSPTSPTPEKKEEPILVKFVAAYVNQLKVVPFSLKEKIRRWYKTSSIALGSRHYPPEDHFLDMPIPYDDFVWEKKLQNMAEGKPDPHDPAGRDEVVVERYPADGRHGGLVPYANTKKQEEEKPLQSKNYEHCLEQDRWSESPTPGMSKRPSEPVLRAGSQIDMLSVMSNRGSQEQLLDGEKPRKPPLKKGMTNVSLLGLAGSSPNLDIPAHLTREG
eukprot:m.54646 g.54646  ORF g.54646 m.54646 type:complete len:308 (-) comp10939_c0_seq1:202-1125(-)